LSEPIRFSNGDRFYLFNYQLNYNNFPQLLTKKDIILANDSKYSFEVVDIKSDRIELLAHSEGELATNKGLHVPGITEKLPFIFKRDKELLKAAEEENLSYISLSYTRNANDIKEIKLLLEELKYTPEIVAKIETKSAVENLGEILEEVNIVNIDRGDLSTEIGLLKLGQYQDQIIDFTQKSGKDIFLATQFLKNMESYPVPLIPEIIDLGNSLNKGINGIQLSEETAIGKYPVECVRLVWDILSEIR